MNRQMSWGIAALIIVLIAAGGFMYWQWSSVQQLKEELAQDEKLLEDRNKQQTEQPVTEVDRKPPPGASPNGHWHDGVWHDEPHEPIVQQEQQPSLTPKDREKLWVSENGRTLTTFTAEGWPIPEGTLPSEIDLEGANALRKKLYTGLTDEEVSTFDTSQLSPEEKKLYPQANMAELYHRKPDKWILLREAHERLRDANELLFKTLEDSGNLEDFKRLNPHLFSDQ